MKRRLLALAAIACAAVAALAPPATASTRAAAISGVGVHPWRFDSREYLPLWPMREPEVREQSFAALEAAGVRTARVDLRWHAIEGRMKGFYDWAEFDTIHASARRHGVSLLPVVAFTPSWANRSGEYWAPPSNPDDFRDFLAAALERYPDIEAWEIWNEPNMGLFWRPQPDVGGFVALLRAADAARDRTGSDAKIVSGGLSSTGEDPFRWFDEMARLGAFDHVDGFGIHPYGRTAPDAPRAFFLKLPEFRRRLEAIGKPGVGVWATEYSTPNTSADSSYGAPVSADEQALNVGRAHALAANWPWLENLSWHELQDGCDDGADPECRFGLLGSDLKPKPAYGRLRDTLAGGPLPLLRSDTSVQAAPAPPRIRPRSTKAARKRRPAPRTVTVTGTLATAGLPDAGGGVEVTATLAGSARPPVRVLARAQSGAFSAQLKKLTPGAWQVVARFAGTDRHLSSESRVVVVRVPRR